MDYVLKVPAPAAVLEHAKAGTQPYQDSVTVVFQSRSDVEGAIEALQLLLEQEPLADKYYGHFFQGAVLPEAEFDAVLEPVSSEDS
ncbi:MAG: hypothetical protein AAGF24_05110 [Cyanobacteria bacterium P01_H01_bin.121]